MKRVMIYMILALALAFSSGEAGLAAEPTQGL